MRAGSHTALQSDINVTPLVDVCLVLLIIFMVVTPLIVNGVPVQLPQVGSPEALARQPLQVTLKADGTLYVGDQVVHIEGAASALESERAHSDRPLVVRADHTVRYGQVAALLAVCREAGFTDVGLAAEKKSTTSIN